MKKPGQTSDLTVLIPYFNAKNHIANAVKSICDQTLLPSHAILYDDGSTDGSHGFVEALLGKSLTPLGVSTQNIRGELNKGRGYARQTLLSHVKTAFVAWLDADDIWHPYKVESQSLFFSSFGRNPEGLILYGNYRVFNQETGITHKVKMPSKVELSLLLGYGTGPRALQLQTAMGHRRSFKSIGFDTSLNWSEDYDFAIRFLYSGGKLINSCTNPAYQVAQYNFSTPRNWQEIKNTHSYLSNKHSSIIKSLGASELELGLYKELKYTVRSYAATNAIEQIKDLLVRASPYKDDPRFTELYQRCRSILNETIAQNI